MTLLVEDTARNNLAAWTIEALSSGHVAGAVLSPFSTPRSTGYKRAARETVKRLQDSGAEVWFDPETHALQMPAVGDYRYYDGWPLWGGPRGQLANDAEMTAHVESVFDVQDDLGLAHLAPTILLHSPQSATSQQALRLAEIAIGIDPNCRVSIAGDAAFWANGSSLDSHVGALAQLEPGGWWVTVVRNFTVLPVQAIPEEVHGLCRTARALGDHGIVHISHGDLAGLPGIAAGATSLGTGWDPRQRVAAYESYEARAGGEGGQWFQQVTHDGLLSLLPRANAQTLATQDPALSARLLPGVYTPGAKESFLHHVEVLGAITAALTQADHQHAYSALMTRYTTAVTDWASAASAVGIPTRSDAWIDPFFNGLQLYGLTEGY